MIQIRDLFKRYGRQDVLRGVSLDLREPGIYAVLGPNGSGKTTLIKCLLGMVLPQRGTLALDGQDIHRQWRYRGQIGYLPQVTRFPENLTVRELLRFVQSLRRETAQADPLIERFGLAPYLGKRMGTLSGGTRQKVNLVLAFMYDCPVYVLDEPSAGLDPVALLQLKALIREARAAGKHILITTHIMTLVEDLADEIVFLLDGQIYFRGSLADLLAQYDEPDLEHAIARLLEQQAPAQTSSTAAETSFASLNPRLSWARF
ncbi:MAG: ABC transporter ATP-binding protein [Bacteroidia bacterium]